MGGGVGVDFLPDGGATAFAGGPGVPLVGGFGPVLVVVLVVFDCVVVGG